MSQQQQAQEIEVQDQPQAPGGIDWGKLLQYSGLVSEIIAKLDALQNLGVGDSEELGEVKLRRAGKRYTLELGTLTRTA